MTTDPALRLIAALERDGYDPRATGTDSWESRCPAHKGSRRNLTVTRADDGRALVCCHHGDGPDLTCSANAITAALGMTIADLFPPDPDRNGVARPGHAGNGKPKGQACPSPEAALGATIRKLGKPTAHWVYPDSGGSEVMRVYRFDPIDPKSGEPVKEFRPVHRDANGWKLGDPPGRLPLYGLPELADARRVYVVEGEKCACQVRALGLAATTSAHGAKSPHKSDWTPLAGLEVVIMPDHDAPGQGYAKAVMGLLAKLDPKPIVRVVRLPLANEGDDIEQWLESLPPEWDSVRRRAELERLASGAEVEELPKPGDSPDCPDCPAPLIGGSGKDWPPLRLGELPPVEAFPVDALPIAVADFVQAVAGSIGCPVDYVGLPVLIVAGDSIGRSVSLLLKPGYFVSASFYGMNVGGATSGKSPSQAAVVRPLWKIDEALHDTYKLLKADFDRSMEAFKNVRGDAKPPIPAKPALQSAVLNDTTVEAIAAHLARNPRGLLVSHDEGSAWVASLNQYKQGKGSDRQFWLSALFGNTVRVDRKGQPDDPIRITCPFLSFIGGMTPDMLGELREQKGRADGFIERVLFVYPDPPPRPHWTDHGIPDENARTWGEIVGRLRARPMEVSTEGKEQPHVVKFSANAKAAWVAWYNAHADEVNSPDFDAGNIASEGKLCDFAARMALILHMLQLASDPTRGEHDPIPDVAAQSVQGAIRLWKYFRSHARRVRAAMKGRGLGQAPQGAKLILNWIKNHPDARSFTESKITQIYPPIRFDRATIEDGLEWLARHHAIRPASQPERPTGTPGRKPARAWEVHPDLLGHQENQDNQDSDPFDAGTGRTEGPDPDCPDSPVTPKGDLTWEY